jgi:hypothetical protein
MPAEEKESAKVRLASASCLRRLVRSELRRPSSSCVQTERDRPDPASQAAATAPLVPRKRALSPPRPLGRFTAVASTDAADPGGLSLIDTSGTKRPRPFSKRSPPSVPTASSIAIIPAHLQTERFARRPRRQSTLFFSSSSSSSAFGRPPPSSNPSSSAVVASTATATDVDDEPDQARRRAQTAFVQSPNGETLRRLGRAGEATAGPDAAGER